jgi:hypothetical protein
MDVKNSLLYLNTLLPSQTKGTEQTQTLRKNTVQSPNAPSRDLVKISPDANQENQTSQNFQKGSRLVSEEIQETERGVRRTQEFQNEEGKKFTRIEEINNGEDRSTRTVIQQNDSGATTLLENVFDRQDDGSFRLTQRFTDETGDTQTNIQFDVPPPNRDIALGRPPEKTEKTQSPTGSFRGSQLDVSA